MFLTSLVSSCLTSAIAPSLSAVHATFAGASVFLVASCTNRTLVEPSHSDTTKQERRLWDELVRRERSLVDAIIKERRRRDDSQVRDPALLYHPTAPPQVRFCRYRFCATGELKYRVRGRVRIQVHV